MSLFSRLENMAAAQPNKPAYIYYSSPTKNWAILTYKQLLASTERFASGLQASALTPNMRAAVMTPPSAEFFALAFAMLKLGIVPIIIDPAVGLKKVGICLDESKPDIFIGNEITHLLRKIFSWGKQTIKINTTISSLLSITKYHDPRDARSVQAPLPHSSAAIIFTSGSTGMPKGVLYTQENFSAQLEMLQQTFNITQDEIDLPAFPLYALIDVLLGVTSVIPDIAFPVPRKTDPEKIMNAIQKFNVTNMFASPVVLDILEKFWKRQQAPTFQSLKRVITAGAPATIQLQEKFRRLLSDETDLFGIYGATETLPIAKVESRELFAIREKTEKGAGVCLGKPVSGLKVRIIKITEDAIEEWQDSLEVESNVVGEITVQGAAVTRSYIHGAKVNRLSKIKIGEDIIHRMGDVGYFDKHGRLWFCGRKSQRVITKNEILFTEQIENIFNAHPSVYRTALVGVEGKPVLWVELESGVLANKGNIRRELIELARDDPQASTIENFLFIKKFPTDVRHNSKIIREELTVLANR